MIQTTHKLFSEVRPHVVRAFLKYHQENPHVYEMVKRFAYEAKASGRQRFGIGMIWERMRWYTMIETKGESFKLSNSHRSCYARLLMVDDPTFEPFFIRKATQKQTTLF